MLITKRQLKRIIREEYIGLLRRGLIREEVDKADTASDNDISTLFKGALKKYMQDYDKYDLGSDEMKNLQMKTIEKLREVIPRLKGKVEGADKIADATDDAMTALKGSNQESAQSRAHQVLESLYSRFSGEGNANNNTVKTIKERIEAAKKASSEKWQRILDSLDKEGSMSKFSGASIIHKIFKDPRKIEGYIKNAGASSQSASLLARVSLTAMKWCKGEIEEAEAYDQMAENIPAFSRQYSSQKSKDTKWF